MLSLKSLHTFSLDAYALDIQLADSIESLSGLLLRSDLEKTLVLGEGSNTVFVDDFKGLVILNRFKGVEVIEREEDFLLSVGAGENWHQLVLYCMQRDIGGFENLALIPGTVGAAPIQNIGAYGVEIERFIDYVEFFDSKSQTIERLPAIECRFAYRDSIFKRQRLNQRIITRVAFKLPKFYSLETTYGPLQSLAQQSDLSAQKICNQVIQIRQSKLPDVKSLGNAGSFFKNPSIDQALFDELSKRYSEIPHFRVGNGMFKIPAAWLIDVLGYKGKRVGDIACHLNQPLVLVNLGKGKGEDLLALARAIAEDVKHHFGIQLENEVRLMGQQGLIHL